MPTTSSLIEQKENIPLRAPRVSWSKARTALLMHPPLAPSAPPPKSILKKNPKSYASVAESQERALPTLGISPLDVPAYFRSPLETILESLIDYGSRVSLHDIVEAYSILSSRIKHQNKRLVSLGRESAKALDILKENADNLANALKRDIRRAFANPRQHDSSFGGSMRSSVRSLETEDEIKLARDSTLLCHQALQLLSDLFTIPALYSLFSTQDLSTLFEGILSIILERSLPTPNSRKTCAISIWLLQAQTLPAVVVSPHIVSVTDALKRAIQGDFGDGSVLDGHKALCNFLKSDPGHFLAPFTGFLPSLLTFLVSDSAALRDHAAHTLNGFVSAKLSLLADKRSSDYIAKVVSSFVAAQSSKRTSAAPRHTLLPRVIGTNIALTNPSHPGEGPCWALSVLASLIVLSDSLLFSHPRSLKLVFPALAQALAHKRSAVRSLHPHIWKCVVWAFSRISADNYHENASVLEASTDIWERAFLVVKQDLRGDIGIALVACILGSADSNPSTRLGGRASKAVTIVADMIGSRHSAIASSGVSLLARLLGSVGAPAVLPGQKGGSWDNRTMLVSQLFDGTLLRSQWENLPGMVQTVEPLRVDQIRQLSETEIVCNWDSLVAVWISIAKLELTGSSISDNLLHMWQSLLLVNSQLTQGHEHLTTPSGVATSVASVISDLVVPTKDPELQQRQLSMITRLWSVVKNVFSPTWFPDPAKFILAAILKQPFVISDEKIKDQWSGLCATLICDGSSHMLEFLRGQNDNHVEIALRRQLWSVLVNNWQMGSNETSWTDYVTLLCIPFGEWILSDHEFEAWTEGLSIAISHANKANISSIMVVNTVIQRLGCNLLSHCPQAMLFALKHIHLIDNITLPTELLSVIDDALYTTYPPVPEKLQTYSQLLPRIGAVVASVSPAQVHSFLSLTGRGLCCWIEDEHEIWTDNEYNEILMPIYCSILDVIRHVSPSPDALRSLTPFFVSAFRRLPPPALGPLAFQAFWKSTYQGLDLLYSSCPEELKMCLRAFDEAYDDSLAVGLSLEVDSTTSSVIPDSQPFPGDVAMSCDFEADFSRYPLPEDTFSMETTRTEVRAGGIRHSSSSQLAEVCSPEKSHNLPTPRSSTHVPSSPPAALQQLLDYDSGTNDKNGNKLVESPIAPQPRPFKNSISSNQASSSSRLTATSSRKRSNESEGKLKPKRRKTGESSDAECRYRPQTLQPRGQKSTSAPTTRVQSPILSARAISEPTGVRKRTLLECVEVPTYRQIRARQRRRTSPVSPVAVAHNHSQPQIPPNAPPLPVENYDDWDTALTTPEIRRIQRDPDQNSLYTAVPDSGDEVESFADDRPDGPSRRATEPALGGGTALQPLLSPFQAGFPMQTGRQVEVPQPPPLHRSKTTSARLAALQHAYAAVTSDASQVPVEDLLQATKLVHKIGSALSEQMSKRLGDRRR